MSSQIDEALAYLRTGGLGEVEGFARVAFDMGTQRVACSTDVAIALCMLAGEALDWPAKHSLRVAELLEANNRYLERARAADLEIARLTRSLDHLRRQARRRDDVSTCLACEKEIFAGVRYFPDVGGFLCAECAPTYQSLIDEPESHVHLDDEESRTAEDCRAEFDAHIAAGGKPTDTMATQVLE